MIPFDITILGSNSAIPAHGRHPAAHFLNIRNHSILVDCGEGTQIRLREVERANLYHISHIFISHLPGDHFLGLAGLLSSLGLMRREKPMHLYAHKGLQQILAVTFSIMEVHIEYEIIFHELPLEGTQIICDHDDFKVTAFQLTHRIACCGFLFEEKFAKKKIRIEALEKYRIPKEYWNRIQRGENYLLPDGTEIANEELTRSNASPRSYAYCSDTVFTEDFVPVIQHCNTVFIESTYTEQEAGLATARYHCTAAQAAKIAKKANVNQLIIGHFSSRYKHLDVFLEQAKKIFPQTALAIEGKTFEL